MAVMTNLSAVLAPYGIEIVRRTNSGLLEFRGPHSPTFVLGVMKDPEACQFCRGYRKDTKGACAGCGAFDGSP